MVWSISKTCPKRKQFTSTFENVFLLWQIYVCDPLWVVFLLYLLIDVFSTPWTAITQGIGKEVNRREDEDSTSVLNFLPMDSMVNLQDCKIYSCSRLSCNRGLVQIKIVQKLSCTKFILEYFCCNTILVQKMLYRPKLYKPKLYTPNLYNV